MFTLVIGGSASGKSEYAERLLLASSAHAARVYIATMQPHGEQARARIEKHRTARAGRGFETVERYTALAGLSLPCSAAVLLECVTNLLANEMFSPDGVGEDAVPEILRGITHLRTQSRELIVVSGDVFADGADYDQPTIRYIQALGQINRAAAAMADRVVEVVCGIPIAHKGELL